MFKFFRKPVLDNYDNLCDDLLMVVRIVDNASMLEHIEAANNLLRNFTKKWRLDPTRNPSPLYESIGARIAKKRNQLINEDSLSSIRAIN